VDNTRDYARVSHSRQWSNYNLVHVRKGLDVSISTVWMAGTTDSAEIKPNIVIQSRYRLPARNYSVIISWRGSHTAI